MEKFVPLIGRTFLAVIFLRSGIGKLFGFAATQEQIAAQGLPIPALLLVGSIILEIFGSLSVILGWKARWGAIALILFLIPTTLVFHTNFADPNQVIQFFKNLSILGGLLLVSVWGAGPVSIDTRTTSPSQTKESERMP